MRHVEASELASDDVTIKTMNDIARWSAERESRAELSSLWVVQPSKMEDERMDGAQTDGRRESIGRRDALSFVPTDGR